MERQKWQAAVLAAFVRFANTQLGQALREYAQVIHLAPALLPSGLGLLPSQQAKVAEELRALLQAATTVDQKGLVGHPQGSTGREAGSGATKRDVRPLRG